MAKRETKTAGSKQPAPSLARLFPDLPVDDGEELQFDFEGLARTLAELALNPDNRTPFTVVVKGGWGRGKTTLLRRAKWLLENPDEVTPEPGQRRVETLWFNAWKYPDEDTVLAGLLGALLDRLHKGDLGDQLKKLVDSYKGSILKTVLYLAAPAPLKELIAEGGLESRFSPVQEKRAFHDTFRDLFSQVSALLFHPTLAIRDSDGVEEEARWTPERQRRETLAIFLDDLDRCRQSRVAEVLEAINLFLDLPGVCFYLGIDWSRLTAALPEPVRAQGDQYLEKIVQVVLDLPTVSAPAAESYIRTLVKGTHLGDVLRGRRQSAVIADALKSRNPRHVKRFLNDLAMTLAVMRNAGRLGQGDDQLPEESILVWHLLSEVLPADKWREIQAREDNIKSFLRESAVLERKDTEQGELSEEWQRLRAGGFGRSHLQPLAELTDGQLHILIHLASPPVTEDRQSRSPGRVDLLDLDSGAWVPLEGGIFAMGSEKGETREQPVHEVTLSPFRISRYPVTNADYALHVRETGKRAPDHWVDGQIPAGKENHPVVQVSWSDARAFCGWLTRRLTDGGNEGSVRLPTEAQWELAARGVEGREYPWGKELPDEDRANFDENVKDTTSVGSYPRGATPEGIHDLAGNVWEWCRDGYREYDSEDQRDPTGPERGSTRVLRGGAFINDQRFLRGAFRLDYRPMERYVYVGFRVVWSSAPGLD